MMRLRVGVAGLVLSMAMGVAVGMVLYTFDYAEGTAYLSNDPRACVNCHIMRENFDGWQKASHHAAATCNDCHVPVDPLGKYAIKAEHGFRHSKGFTFQDFHEPILIKQSSLDVVQRNCVRCHEGVVREIASHRQQPDEPQLNCVHCHQSVGHGPRK